MTEAELDALAEQTMPLLTIEVVEQLRHDAEAQHALADSHQERAVAHGLNLLCEWQEPVIVDTSENLRTVLEDFLQRRAGK